MDDFFVQQNPSQETGKYNDNVPMKLYEQYIDF